MIRPVCCDLRPGDWKSRATSAKSPYGDERVAEGNALGYPPEKFIFTGVYNLEAKKYHIWNIGCQMNVADANHVAAELDALGYEPVARAEDADLLFLESCVVRQSAEDKVVGHTQSLKALKVKHPGMKIALMGCLVGIHPAPQLRKQFPHVDFFLPPSDPSALIEALGAEEQAAQALEIATTRQRYQLQDSMKPVQPIYQSIRYLSLHKEPPVTAYVSIVYGCSHACTYCIIPARRGGEKSRPLAEIIDETKDLVRQGVHEVTYLGQIVDRYGKDFGGAPDLADLLYEASRVEGLWRIRFLTSHPSYLDDRILRAVADLPKVCEHIEVPIQAGADEVLRNMRRGYTVAEYEALVAKIRRLIPGAAIHTDVIVGFPGESEAQFMGSYRVLHDLRLDKAHLARYSPRPGTVSARTMVDDVPDEEKRRRHQLLETLQESIQKEKNAALVGQTVEVLVEGRHKGKWWGRTRTNKLVFFPQEGAWQGQLVDVLVEKSGPYSLQGRLL